MRQRRAHNAIFQSQGDRHAVPPNDSQGHKLPRGKNMRLEYQITERRLLLVLLLVCAALLLLGSRMAQLQVMQHEHFTTLSDSNRMRLQPLPPTRGLIYDRNGVLLAGNLPSHRLEIVREQLADGFEATLEQLRSLVTIEPTDVDRFFRLSRNRAPYSGVPLRFNLSEDEVARLSVDLHRMAGVAIQADLTRYYPLGPQVAHTVGYVGRIDEREMQVIDTSQYAGSTHIGKTGIERSYEDLLRGRVGHQRVETNAQGRILRVLDKTPPVPGMNVYLSLDVRLQNHAKQALGEQSGAIVAIDPRNGEVLAFVSTPDYDPNLFVNGISHADYRALNTDPERPLFNRALLGAYPPGSTIKPMMSVAGMTMGVADQNRSVYCPGYFTLPGQSSRRFRDWLRTGHGMVNMTRAVAESCDVYYYQLALDMGIERLYEHLTQFGFSHRTGIDLVGERAGLIPSPEWKRRVHNQPWYTGETVIAGIGQGYMLTTPLQLAHATAALAMRGQRFRPRLLYATQGQNGQGYALTEAESLPPVGYDDQTGWRYINHSMIEVVHGRRGTARRIGQGLDYQIAGKTGTSQVFGLGQDEEYDAGRLPRHLHDHALFIAYAPADKPRIAIAAIVEHGGGGSSVAAPIVRQVLDGYFELWSETADLSE